MPICILYAFPRCDFFRHMETLCLGVFDTHKDVDVSVGNTAELAILRLSNWSG